MSATTRPYRMQARAEASEQATERILDAAERLFWEDPARPVTLAAAAALAGVSVHSIIRRFGGQEGMLAAAASRSLERVRAARTVAPGDTVAAVRVLVDHYEEMGDRVMRMLVLETQSPALREAAEGGRLLHAQWCESSFGPALARRQGARRRRLLAQLVVVCDVYSWHMLRRQRRLSRRETERALVELLEPLVDEGSP